MPQVMPAEVFDAGALDGGLEGGAKVNRPVLLAPRKHEVRVDAPDLGALLHEVEGMADQRQRSDLAVFGFEQRDRTAGEVRLPPPQAEDLHAARAGGQRKHHGAVEIGRIALAAFFKQAGALVVGRYRTRPLGSLGFATLRSGLSSSQPHSFTATAKAWDSAAR